MRGWLRSGAWSGSGRPLPKRGEKGATEEDPHALAEITVPEARRLLEVALPLAPPSVAAKLAWSHFRRRMRQRARTSHRRRRTDSRSTASEPATIRPP